MPTTTNKLPNTAHELIRAALADLEKVEADPNYEINMRTWVDYRRPNGKCAVCLAGAVMAKTLDCRVDEDTGTANPKNFDWAIERKLLALNEFRTGCVLDGLSLFYDCSPTVFDYLSRNLKMRLIPEYDWSGPQYFKDEMRRLANDLQEAGL